MIDMREVISWRLRSLAKEWRTEAIRAVEEDVMDPQIFGDLCHKLELVALEAAQRAKKVRR